MTQSMGSAVLRVLLLSLVLVPCPSATDVLLCGDYPNLAMMFGLASACFAACPDVCAPLSEAVTLSLAGGDPLPAVCAGKDAFACITGSANRNICSEMLETANFQGIAVPRTTEAMRAVCLAAANQTDTNTTTTAAANRTGTTTTAADQADTNTTTTTTPQISKTSSVASRAGVWLLLAAATVAC